MFRAGSARLHDKLALHRGVKFRVAADARTLVTYRSLYPVGLAQSLILAMMFDAWPWRIAGASLTGMLANMRFPCLWVR